MPPPKAAAAAAGDYEGLVARQQELEDKIRGSMGDVVGPDTIITPPLTAPVPPKRKKGEAVSLVDLPPMQEKTDTHWDYLLKEMQWLATDFASERKRHQSSRRRLSNGVRQHFKSQESRAQAAIVQAEAKRRKLASKLTREVKGWWTKLEKVITYRQKVVYDKSRQQAMNRQLVTLVKQTEKYTESLAHTKKAVSDESSDSEEDSSPSNSARRKRRRNKKKRHKGRRKLTIEEALSQSTRRRKVHDYAQLAKTQSAASASEDEESVTMYGVTWESTSDNPSDSSYGPESAESEDDETTLREAEVDEQRERLGNNESEIPFVADPVELLKLQEEQEMDIKVVLERLHQETIDHELPVPEESKTDETNQKTKEGDESKTETDESAGKKVKFAEKPAIHRPDPGADADDDGDASDVEDFEEPDNADQIEGQDDAEADVGDEEEYQPEKGADVDDETTIEAEEKMGRDMSYQDELALLQREGEMSVEELRAMYSGLGESSAVEDDAMDVDEVDESEEKDNTGISELLDQSKGDGEEEEEFLPTKGDEVDDETTIEAEERLGREMSYEDEIALLQREGEMSVEELRAMYAGISNQDVDASKSEKITDVMNVDDRQPSGLASLEEEIDEQENDGDFQPDKNEVDDETTMEAEEKLGREMSYEDEINLLKRESEMSVEELKAAYLGAGDSETGEEEESENGKRKCDEDDTEVPESKRQKTETGDGTDTEAALAALEASAERARSTLASRPFLLSKWVKLREYQQIGLNWLVSLHSRRLNGILADEMGLGKTLQTITLLAYLAAYKGIWGPHLVIVPTSVILNWETELKRFCPSFKVLCYYGSAKRRKELRTGWTKPNVYHVVITSYQLAVQDAFAFKRKRWYYLILDEAQNIKNFQSQRWQTLISFNTQRRLLLSGTPLQNTLMELWSLLHFLMPYIFRSRKEFSYWFANPMSSMIEGEADQNNDVVNRLHGILRPFILRRLKKDVETQMPGKFEHIVKCQLSRRQMYLYEEFMARSTTRHALKSGSGNFMAMMNVLMQLRKVCNHPDLFEPRSVITPFVLDPVSMELPHTVFLEGPTEETASRRLLAPLWCGSTGEPGLNIALSHDPIESDELSRLREDLDKQALPKNDSLVGDVEDDDDDLRALIDRIRRAREENRTQMTRFHNTINTLRCDAECFPYNLSLQEAVKTPGTFQDRSDFHVLNTPADLLAMRRTQQGRANEMDQLIKKFVFCVPKAGLREEGVLTRRDSHDLNDSLLSPVEEYLAPFRGVRARLSSFFPDKKLIQFDAGKLQTLAELLRELKRGGHKTLIFTQMSKMLDILEAFLNLNGHVYLRLDGSTGIDRRQRLMDKFNSDPKIFCFILSTRSGGLGINLTGADTVVFYDTDWNPAMDAQAQDRAHRIGQTREVHVYRLVTEQTIEENILMKAKQKRNLDILVMDRGKFDSSHLFRSGDEARLTAPDSSSQDMYSKSGLQSILGLQDKDGGDEIEKNVEPEKDKEMSAGEMEAAMTTLEDNDDVQALRGAQKEAAEELKEFDESEDIKRDDGEEEDQQPQQAEVVKETDEKTEREALEKEFAAWQTEVGMDNEAIEASLSPIERYGLKLREDIDPFYSLYAVLEYNRKIDEEEEADKEIDIEEIEAEKAEDERLAIIDGDLLVTDPPPDELVRQRNLFQRERARLKANMKRRQMTGENWEVLVDQHSNTSFWYNKDTGEARWDKPPVLIELESYEKADNAGFGMLPIPSLLKIMSFLVPHPERMKAALVCRQWRKAAMDVSFIHHVYPVEMGAATRSKMHHNHYRSLTEAITKTQQGDTIEFSDGHYWVNEDMTIDRPLRLVGDEYHPANVIVEMNNGSCIEWEGQGGWMEGITFRRPQIASAKIITKPLIRMHPHSRLHMYACTIDNEGSTYPTAVSISRGGRWKREGVSVRRGEIEVMDGGLVDMI